MMGTRAERKRPLASYRYDPIAAIRPQFTTPIRPISEKPSDATSVKSMMLKKFATPSAKVEASLREIGPGSFDQGRRPVPQCSMPPAQTALAESDAAVRPDPIDLVAFAMSS